MRRGLFWLALVGPALALTTFYLWPELDQRTPLPNFHFYVVTFTTFAAAILSIILGATLHGVGEPRDVLAAAAFGAMGAIFFLHGLYSPGVVTDGFHPALSWSAWLTLFAGGGIFTLASLDVPGKTPAWFNLRRIGLIIAVVVGAYIVAIQLVPQTFAAIQANATPRVQDIIYYLSLLVWAAATLGLGRIYRRTGRRADAMFFLVAAWLTVATVSLHRFDVWMWSWWLYHFILLVGFLGVFGVLLSAYEQTRAFSLARYYLLVSALVTALLALVASALFGEYSRRILVTEMRVSVTSLIDTITRDVEADLPAGLPTQEALAHYADYYGHMPMSAVYLFDLNGRPLLLPDGDATPAPATRAATAQRVAALAPDAREVTLHAPGETPPFYDEPAGVHVFEVLVPVSNQAGRPMGALLTLRESPELTRALVQARLTGLLTAVLTMGVLFGCLTLVVFRGDRIIRQRTEELAVAYGELKRSEDIRADLMSMIVHDLRTPLTTIMASIDLARRGNGRMPVAKRDQLLQRAGNASRRMNHLVDDILATSKMEAGELTLNVSETAVAPLLREGLDAFADLAAVQRKRLALDCPPDLQATFDPALIGRVVQNLLGNAFKYTLQGEGEIAVSARRVNGRGPERLEIAVTDNGPGVPDAQKQRIFEKFAVVPGDEVQQRRGTGLGLAFCQLTVRAHEGDIEVRDAPDGGSQFLFWLPQP